MATIAPLDLLFLLMEAREKPAHVGGLQLYRPPEGTEPGHLGRLHEEAITSEAPIRSLFTRRVHRAGGFGPPTWVADDRFDLEYHVRHSALPAPGRIRELLALVSRLHGTLLDRNRPLWEAHLIEGLQDGRFALYTKVHHALVDGVAAMRLLQDSMSDDPDDLTMPFPWEKREPRPREPRPEPAASSPWDAALSLVAEARGMPQVGASILRGLVSNFREEASASPFQAPRTMFNVPITGARRFAADSWPLDRVRAVASRYGATVNDVVLAMSGGALRGYLIERGALPDQPLIAMVPVSLKTGAPTDAAGNAVGVILCNLGTHLEDPADRLALVQESMAHGKRRFEGLSALQIMLLSSLSVAPAALSIGPLGKVEFMEPLLRPPFNVVISNVPGPRKPLYFRGSAMEGMYPVSVVVDGQAMNITVTSYGNSLDFGIIGCRRTVPHLQRFLDHLEGDLSGLEKA